MRDHRRVAYLHWATRREVHVLPQAHVLVRRRRIPIHPINPEIILRLREDFDCNDVSPRLGEFRRDIKFKFPIRSRNIFRVGDLLPVDPHIRAVVDTVKMECHVPMIGWRRKLRPVPPGCSVRTVIWNRLVRELLADLVRSNSGNFPQIHPVVRVRKFSTRDPYSDYGHWH
jgi:hypothetical protein